MSETGSAKELSFIVITGLSGAGKSQAMRSMEDQGYFCVDNLPPALLPKFAEICQRASAKVRRVAAVVDIRGGEFFDRAVEALAELDEMNISYHILFLEADDETLIKRYKETRRRHPLAPEGRVLAGINAERQRLETLRGRAHRIIDTGVLRPADLAVRLAQLYGDEHGGPGMTISIISFGYKHGLPLDADLVMDVRFLPNPHYVTSLQHLTGHDPEVKEYVLKWPITRQFLRRLKGWIGFLVPQYVNEGKSHLTIAIGCTGGQHRSVVVALQLAEYLRRRFPRVVVDHRDVTRAADREGIPQS
ncbi:MAG: RNase adapter RapZ [Thermaerobacterales bacterium]